MLRSRYRAFPSPGCKRKCIEMDNTFVPFLRSPLRGSPMIPAYLPSVGRRHTQVVEEECVDVYGLLDPLSQAAASMAGVGIDANQDRVITAALRLQRRCVFERVRGNDAVIMVCGGNQSCRILHTLANVM